MATTLTRSKWLIWGVSQKKELEKKLTKAFRKGKRWARLYFSAETVEEQKLHRAFLRGLERARTAEHVYIAAPTQDYRACWIRDQLYCTYAYFERGEIRKFKKGMHVVFDILNNQRAKIERAIVEPPREVHEFIHAKYHPKTLKEITFEWGHHQLDAIGLFLFLVGKAEAEKQSLLRKPQDKELLQLLVSYLAAVRYWERPDFGMWEEGPEIHASSLGAVVAGLEALEHARLALVPRELILRGRETLDLLLPRESESRETDLAQLSLIWPLCIVSKQQARAIVWNVIEKLAQKNGINRYLGDNYYRSQNGISGEWTFGFFWLSIIFSNWNNKKQAEFWYHQGISSMTSDGHIPELYCDDSPNEHTPLAWAHAMALIAREHLKKFSRVSALI